MNTQISLFKDADPAIKASNGAFSINDIPNYRKTDPKPSRVAARKMCLGDRAKNAKFLYKIMVAAKSAGKGGFTSREWYFKYQLHFDRNGIDRYELARRLSDLKGFEKDGKPYPLAKFCEQRKCQFSNKILSTYIAI